MPPTFSPALRRVLHLNSSHKEKMVPGRAISFVCLIPRFFAMILAACPSENLVQQGMDFVEWKFTRCMLIVLLLILIKIEHRCRSEISSLLIPASKHASRNIRYRLTDDSVSLSIEPFQSITFRPLERLVLFSLSRKETHARKEIVAATRSFRHNRQVTRCWLFVDSL